MDFPPFCFLTSTSTSTLLSQIHTVSSHSKPSELLVKSVQFFQLFTEKKAIQSTPVLPETNQHVTIQINDPRPPLDAHLPSCLQHRRDGNIRRWQLQLVKIHTRQHYPLPRRHAFQSSFSISRHGRPSKTDAKLQPSLLSPIHHGSPLRFWQRIRLSLLHPRSLGNKRGHSWHHE